MADNYVEYMLEREKVKSLEEIYLDYKKSYLYHILAKIQRIFDEKGFHQGLAYLVMIIYTYEYMDMTGYKEELKDFLRFTGWDLDRYAELSGKSLEEKINLAVNIDFSQLSSQEREEIKKMVMAAWKLLGLDKTPEEEIDKVVEEKRKQYFLLESLSEKERRKIVEFLAERNIGETQVNLLNIGIVPTELCPNNCRFCVAAWKASTEQRGKAVSDEDFRRIADQVLSFAAEKNLIVTVTGGEPFLRLDRLIYLITNARGRLDITTSCIWAESDEKAEEILRKLDEARKNNPGVHLSLQLSLDAFHQEVFRDELGKLTQNVPLENVLRVVKLAEKFPEIEFVLLTKLTSYPDPLIQLLLRLKEDGYSFEIRDKLVSTDVELPVIENGEFKTLPALLKGYLFIKTPEQKEIAPIQIFYTVVESMGKALALQEFEFPGFRGDVKELASGDFNKPLPIIGIEVSDDGYVYPGAHALYSWSIGNLLEEDIDTVYKRLCHDPIVKALYTDPKLIVNIVKEVEEVNFEGISSPVAAIFKLLEKPDLRLYITRRLLQEIPEYAEAVQKLKIPSKEELLQNYKKVIKDNK